LKAIDTNVLVRYLVGDDVRQAMAARRLLEHESVWLGLTVLLEATWVLESAYDFPPAAVAETVELFLGLPNVHVEGPAQVARALEAQRSGARFADALHVACSMQSAASFATFDRQLARGCRGLARIDLLA
jgi:predicted nucleic acid-binding protein